MKASSNNETPSDQIAKPAKDQPPLTKEQAIMQYGSYGVKRSVGVRRPDAGRSKPRYIWRWAIGGLLVLLLSFGLFAYFRVSSFLDSSFSGRNEASLLTTTPNSKRSTPTPINQAQYPTGTWSNQPTATPAQGRRPPTLTPAPPTPTFSPSMPAAIQKIKRGEPITTLVIGYGGGNHDGSYLTDTIMLLTYDPVKDVVTMVNLPRDLYVFIPYGGPNTGYWGKINSAFAYIMDAQDNSHLSWRYWFNPSSYQSRIDAGVNLLKDVVEQVMGTPVDYWATLSFDGFRRFIDAIGGIDVYVDTAFDDYEYPANDDPSIDASVMHIHFDAGLQHLYGERAIQYARSRKSLQDGNDFGRSKRQMKVIAAVKERVTKPDIMLKAFGMMDALQGSLRTSLSLGEAQALMNYFRGEGALAAGKMSFVPQVLSTANFLNEGTSNEGAYILFPKAGMSNYSAIQTWLEQGRQYPELRAEAIKVQVQNGTGQAYLADRLNDDMNLHGLTVLDAAWVNAASTTVILDYSNGKAANTLKTIVEVLPGVPVRTLKRPANQLADVVILLGRDFYHLPGQTDDSQGPIAVSGITTPAALTTPLPKPTPSPTPTIKDS